MAKRKPAPKKKPTKQVEGRMDITKVVQIMKRVHDVEGWDLGSGSSRETRNHFLERVVGIVHWGHEKYNPTADKQWHCKDPDQLGSGRPASDDVVVSMPSRTIYDCIPGCGADGYTFASNPGGEHMPDQTVFIPEKPKLVDGPGGGSEPGTEQPPAPQPVPVVPDRGEALDELRFLDSYYANKEGLQRPDGLSLNGKPDFEGIAAWYLDVYQQARLNGKDRADARNEYVKQIRGSHEWQQKHPGETP